MPGPQCVSSHTESTSIRPQKLLWPRSDWLTHVVQDLPQVGDPGLNNIPPPPAPPTASVALFTQPEHLHWTQKPSLSNSLRENEQQREGKWMWGGTKREPGGGVAELVVVAVR